MTERISRPPLPFEPEPIEAMRARLGAAIGHVNPYGARLQLATNRQHAFDFEGVSPQRGNRLVLSVDDGPEVGPKLHASLFSVDEHGREKPLNFSDAKEAPLVLEIRLKKLLSLLTGVRAEPFLVLVTRSDGPPESLRPHSLHAFFRYDDFPSPN